MPAHPEQREAAQDKLRDLFFALAFDPDSEAATAAADEALHELDRLISAAAAERPTAPAPRTAQR